MRPSWSAKIARSPMAGRDRGNPSLLSFWVAGDLEQAFGRER